MKILIRVRWRNLGVSFVIFLALVLTITACGCSGSGDKQQSGTKSQSPPAFEHVGAIDACRLITQDDASTLFGKPANRDKGTPVIDPNLLGECLWSWEAETGNQLLQFRIWQGTQYYGSTPDSQPFDLGEKAYIRAHRVSGVDVEWVQEGRTISLSYSTVGPGTPDPLTRIEEMKQLARKAAAQLSRA